MNEWKDISSYSQREQNREPRTFELKVAGLRIVVTKHIDFEPDEWVLICEPFVNELKFAKGESAEVAKSIAKNSVIKQLNLCIDGLLK